MYFYYGECKTDYYTVAVPIIIVSYLHVLIVFHKLSFRHETDNIVDNTQKVVVDTLHNHFHF